MMNMVRMIMLYGKPIIMQIQIESFAKHLMSLTITICGVNPIEQQNYYGIECW